MQALVFENAAKAQALACSLFPSETWNEKEPHIFVASRRTPRSKGQRIIFEKEMVQARILTERGCTVYLLPELSRKSSDDPHPDAVVDGLIMEFKTVTGAFDQIEHRFADSRKQAENVFLKFDPDFDKAAVLHTLKWKCKKDHYTKGLIWVYFSQTREFFSWNIADWV
jgi:hypothetical protein